MEEKVYFMWYLNRIVVRMVVIIWGNDSCYFGFDDLDSNGVFK